MAQIHPAKGQEKVLDQRTLHELLRYLAKLLLSNRQENSPKNEAQINKPQPEVVETRALTAP